MNLEDELITDRGLAIGFGRVKIPKIPAINFDLEVPLFSFVVIERDDDRLKYIASCIHLPVDGYGNSVEDAKLDMAMNISFLLHENFKDADCRKNIWETVYMFSKSNPNSSVLWDKYHALQCLCAKNGESTDTHYTKLQEKIVELEDKVKELEKELKEKDSSMTTFRDSFIAEVMGYAVVEYGEPEKKGELALK